MNRDTIYIRTEKGERALAAPQELAPGLDSILGAFDGQSSLEALSNRLDPLNASLLDVGVAALLEGDLIRDASQGPSAGTANDEHARKAQELRDKIRDRRQGGDRGRSSPAVDAWYKAKREVEQVAAREAEAQARRAAEEQVRRAAEEQARRAAEEQARRSAEEQAKRAAEEQARRAAAEYARRAAEDEARRQEEERARQEAEERARHEAEREKQEAEERARRAEEEKARAAALAEEQRAAAEQARQRAEVQARLLAEEAAWQEAEERARAEEAAAKEREQEQAASAEAFKRSGRPRNIGKSVGIGVVGLVVIGLAALHVVPFDGQIPQFEKALGSQFQQPVKIKSIHLALLPGSQVRLEGVSIGAEGQIKVATVRAAGSIGNLFSENKSFKAIELESPAVTEEGLGWIMFGKRPAGDIPFGEVTVSGGTLESKRIALPAFDGKLQLDEGGGWKTLALGSTDKTMQVLLTAKGSSAQIEGRAAAFKLPFGSTLSFEDFSINGTVDRAGLTLTEFKGFVHGGTLSGTAALKWGPTWTLSGEVNAKQIDTARVVPELMGSARLEGKASYVMQAADSAKLFDLARAEGSFAIPRGTLLGLDLGSVLQGGATRGETKFGELTGSFSTDQGVTQLKQLRMSQGNMSASGNLDIDAEKKIRGRITAELRLSTEARRINLSVSGTPAKLDWQR